MNKSSEKSEVGIYVDIAAIDTSDVTREEKPQDFWSRKFWFDRYASRDDLEIQINKDKMKIMRRIMANESVNVMLPLRRGQPKEFNEASYMPTPTFMLYINNADTYHKVEQLMRKVYYGDHSWEVGDFMIWKGRTISKYTDISESELKIIFDAPDHLSFHTNFIKSFGGYEGILNREMIGLLQQPDQDYDLQTVQIHAYMQRLAQGGNVSEAPTHLLPVDIREYSAYADIVDSLIRAADATGFSGFRCEWVIVGQDRNSLVLLIEDGGNNWCESRYQIAFEISLYQLPGKFHGTPQNVIFKRTKENEHFALDTIIASGDKCDSVAAFTDWAEGYYFGYRVD